MTNEERFHTAEERVKAVQDFRTRAHYLDTFYDDKRTTAMLRQAANDAEELEKLKARLEAVVKEIDMRICHPSESNCKRCGDHRGNCQCGSLSNNGMMKLLKLAKGE